MKIWEINTFWGRVEEKCDKKGIDLITLAEKIGMSASTFYNLRSTGKIPQKDGAVEKMAKVLGTSAAYLLEGKDDKNSLTPDEEKLLLLFSQLTDDKKEAVINLIASML